MKNRVKRMIAPALALGIIALGSYSFSTEIEEITNQETTFLNDKDGEKLFKAKCTTCHRTSPPQTDEDRRKMKAPPIMGVMYHVTEGIKADNPKEKKEKVIAFIVDYAHNPSKDKSFCEEHAIKRFGIMPSQKENVSKEELKQIAEYLYETYGEKEIDHDKLQKQMHGKKHKH